MLYLYPFHFLRSFDHPVGKTYCYLAHKKCGEPNTLCPFTANHTYCEPITSCSIPFQQYGENDRTSAVVRDNVTVTCWDGFRFEDGKRRSVHHCQPDGQWNATIQFCMSHLYLKTISGLTNDTDALYDDNVTTCMNFTDRKAVYLNTIRTTTVEVTGWNITCASIYGHISVMTAYASIMNCPTQAQNTQDGLVQCRYLCKPGYGILIQFKDVNVCDVSYGF